MSYLFEYFDIFLSIIVIPIFLFLIFSKKSATNNIINFFACNLITMLISFCILDEQIQIGKFLTINILFLLVVNTIFFYMVGNSYMKFLASKMEKIKISSYMILFASILLISVATFSVLIRKPVNQDVIFPTQNLLIEKDEFYKEKMKKLNKSKIFKNMTEIAIIYSGISVALLFFQNKRRVAK